MKSSYTGFLFGCNIGRKCLCANSLVEESNRYRRHVKCRSSGVTGSTGNTGSTGATGLDDDNDDITDDGPTGVVDIANVLDRPRRLALAAQLPSRAVQA